MGRFPLISYMFSTFLSTGALITRIFCPVCGSLHYEIEQNEECLCFGCGQLLSVYGMELIVSDIPSGCYDEEEHTGEDPDYPSFWFYHGS